MPVYGEKYLERAVRSLLGQTLEDVEFIFVDDRSPDSAYDILLSIIAEERYARLKDNIRIVRHDVNRGVPAVRRTGWEASTGDYIYQCDSDDWLDPEILRVLWEKAVEGGYDIVECNYWEAEGEDSYHKPNFPPPPPYEDWIICPCTPTFWNKLVKRSVYDKMMIWPQNSYLEDIAIVSQLICNAEKRCYMDRSLYFYFQNTDGIMLKTDNRNRVVGMTDQIELLSSFMRGKGLYFKYRDRLDSMRSEAMQAAWGLPWKEFIKVFPKDRLRILCNRYIPLRTRLGHMTKLLGIHGISKLFCIIAIFV